MPNPKMDTSAAAFSERLHEAMTDAGIAVGRGRGALLAKRHKVSGVTANAWLSETHMPAPEKALVMARDYGVDFAWLYFGLGLKRAATTHAGPASQSGRPNFETIADTIKLLLRVLDILGEPLTLVMDQELLADVHEVVLAEGAEIDDGNVIDLTKRIAARLRAREHGNQRDTAAGTGGKDGAAHPKRAARSP